MDEIEKRDKVIADLCWVVAMMKDGLPYGNEMVQERLQSLFAYNAEVQS